MVATVVRGAVIKLATAQKLQYNFLLELTTVVTLAVDAQTWLPSFQSTAFYFAEIWVVTWITTGFISWNDPSKKWLLHFTYFSKLPLFCCKLGQWPEYLHFGSVGGNKGYSSNRRGNQSDGSFKTGTMTSCFIWEIWWSCTANESLARHKFLLVKL